MTARRKAAAVGIAGLAPLALTALAATPAAAHGSMTDPVSRVAACYAEGPEHPTSAACKAAVAAGGSQALYDWNAVRDGQAGGHSRSRIPDGKLCSANNEEYKGLDLPRADWPATKMKPGRHTFHYKATARHQGTFALYITKDGYDPGTPLKWSDLESEPFAKVTNPKVVDGDYVFDGTVPARSGRHLIYSIWQRSDSPEAFYTCSDVVFGDGGGAAGAGSASAPTDDQIAAGADESSMTTMHHSGHGGSGHAGHAGRSSQATGDDGAKPAGGHTARLAETGGEDSTTLLALGGAVAVAAGATVLFLSVRRTGRHSR